MPASITDSGITGLSLFGWAMPTTLALKEKTTFTKFHIRTRGSRFFACVRIPKSHQLECGGAEEGNSSPIVMLEFLAVASPNKAAEQARREIAYS